MARKSKEFRQLFYPDSIQQRNTSVTPSQRKKELAAFKSFKQEIKNDPELKNKNTVFVENPKDFRKMSEILLEYIEPFLEDTDTYQQRSSLVEIAVMAWNLALVSEEARQELLKELFSDHPSDSEDIEAEKELQRLMQKLIKRKQKLFAEEKRFVTDFKLTENAGRFHISVASSFKM
ncbi:MAG: hypothetical protein ACKPB4_10470 [Sphaerospermopsis kisseleviana]